MRRQAATRIAQLIVRSAAGCKPNTKLLSTATTANLAASGGPTLRDALAPTRSFAASHLASLAAPFSSAPGEEEWSMLNTTIYPDPELEVGAPAPEFSAPAVVNGEIVDKLSLADFKGKKYVVLFWYPKDFTYVCPTEIIAFNDRAKEFEALNCQLIAASTDTPEVHLAWIKTPRKKGGLGNMEIPLLSDVTKSIAARYGVLLKDAGIALRGLYIIDDSGVVQHATINNLGIGRSVDETLRTLQAVQFVAEHGEVCPAGWQPGDKAMKADPEAALEYFESAPASQEGTASFGDALRTIKDKRDYEGLIGGGGKVVVKFWAPWCGKCKQLAPFVDELAERHPGVTVSSFDTTEEKLEALSAELGVKGLPTFRFYMGGNEVQPSVIGYKKQKLADAVAELEKM